MKKIKIVIAFYLLIAFIFIITSLDNKYYLPFHLKNTDILQNVFASYAIERYNAVPPLKITLSDVLTTPNGNHVENVKEWEQYRQTLRSKIQSIIGTPSSINASLNPKIISKVDMGSYIRIKVSYNVDINERVNAYLLVPKGLSKQSPAVLALHQTTKDGKDEVVGITHNTEFSYGLDLVKQGFVVLAPDALTAGERIYNGHAAYDSKPFYDKYPGWSMIGKAIWDNQKALDYLCSLSYVDQKNIMVFGHSEGGVDGLFLTAFDDRVSALAINCGMDTISGDPDPYKWSRLSWFDAIPKLRSYLDEGTVPFDFHELVALVAPRPFLSFSATNDDVFHNYFGIDEIRKQVLKVYKLYNKEDNLDIMLFKGIHSLPNENKAIIYLWLKSNIKK